MKNLILLTITLLFFANCANLEFVYKSNEEINKLIRNTNLNTTGDESDEVYSYMVSLLSSPSASPEYILTINSIRKDEAQVILKDATASKFSIEYNILYDLYNMNKKCTVIQEEIITKDSYDSKSAGYSFGTDLSKKETRKKIISKNIDQFISIIYRYGDLSSCYGEN